jgi:hypothetical protein
MRYDNELANRFLSAIESQEHVAKVKEINVDCTNSEREHCFRCLAEEGLVKIVEERVHRVLLTVAGHARLAESRERAGLHKKG